MSVEDGNNKAITDLGPSLNFHNRSILLNNNIGAGVNATTSKVDITLVSSHPLSELVWCPSKGISVKNAGGDCSLTVKGSAILWGLRPDHMAVSSAKSSSTKLNKSLENFVDDKNDVSSPLPVNFGVEKADASGRVSRAMVMNSSIHRQDEVAKTAGPGLWVENNVGLNTISSNANKIAILNQEGPSWQCNDSTAFVDQEGKSLLKIPGEIIETSERLEFSAENYVLADASVDVKQETLQHKVIHVVDRRIHAENSLANKRKEVYLRKGKGKALSDGAINDERANDNVSHGSARSCNSRKRSLDQQLMVTSKKIKQSSERDADSASFIRQSSSFMSWIANMVKGYPGCHQDDTPSPMLSGMLTTAQTETERCSQEPEGHELRGVVGFRNLFQSISCSKNRVKGRKIFLDRRSKEEESRDVKPSSMVDISAVPLTAYDKSENRCEDSCQSIKMYDQPKLRSPSNRCMILSPHASSKEIQIFTGINTISSTDKERADVSEYNEEKVAEPVGPKRDYLGSLWITRFRPKVSQPASTTVTSKSIICKRVQTDSVKNVSFGKSLMEKVPGEHSPGDSMTSRSGWHNGLVMQEGLVGLEQSNVKDEQNLEIMASVFARRLDALKQVAPFDATSKPSLVSTTCFFCGLRGHEIQACSEITEMELEELFHVIKSYDKFKYSTCLCIKCFQLSHWAIDCPQRAPRKSALGSFVDWSNNIELYSYRKNKERKHLLEKSDHFVGTLGPQGTSENLKPGTESIQLQDSGKLNQDIVDIENPIDPISGRWEVGKPSSPPQNKITATMEEFFDAVRRLHLSRSDFLRLIDSQISPSRLKGFYLRVRLTNWKQGMGGKGYYVACIQDTATATNKGAIDQGGRKTSIAITIGSFTCLVESRYISNQDFLEDELMAWWTETAKCGNCQNPSLEELKQKCEERQSLDL